MSGVRAIPPDNLWAMTSRFNPARCELLGNRAAPERAVGAGGRTYSPTEDCNDADASMPRIGCAT